MINNFPPIVECTVIGQVHPEVQRDSELLDHLTCLYEGGKVLRDNATKFLAKHSKELGTAYLNRIAKLNYDNILATVVSWYTSKLFENRLEFDWKIAGVEKLPEAVGGFYRQLLEDCDNQDTSLDRFFEQVAVEVLVFGKSYFLLDLPKLAVQPSSLAEQEALGGLSPYLVHIHPGTVSNFQKDQFGNFEWLVVHSLHTDQTFLGDPTNVERWTYYDKQQYATYELEWNAKQTKPTRAKLVDSGLHAMSAFREVPIECVRADTKFWLGNRIYLPIIEHFNALNSYSWSLWLANNPLPVFSNGKESEVNPNVTASEYSSIVLPEGAKFEWVEPAGNSWDASQKFLENLRESIYRQCHLISQGRSSRASATVQSAVSKEADMQPAADMLNTLGTLLRTAIQDVLEDIAEIRGDGTMVDVRGMTFAEDTAGTIADLNLVIDSLNIPSPTFRKERAKKLVRNYMKDANADLVQQIVDEIETAPEPIAAPGMPGQQDPAANVSLNITERV